MHNIREEYKQMANKIKEEVKKEEKNGVKLTNAKAIEDLTAQIKNFEGMLLKAQGALEVLQQIESANNKD